MINERLVPIGEPLLELRKHVCLQHPQILLLSADDGLHHDAERVYVGVCAVRSDPNFLKFFYAVH